VRALTSSHRSCNGVALTNIERFANHTTRLARADIAQWIGFADWFIYLAVDRVGYADDGFCVLDNDVDHAEMGTYKSSHSSLPNSFPNNARPSPLVRRSLVCVNRIEMSLATRFINS